MKIGILFTVNEYTVDPATLARKMEALGFESLWIPEHAIIPVDAATPVPESPAGQGRIPEVYSHICDPFIAMSLAAAVTTRLKLATGVMLVPERNPIVAAKEIATLHHFSGGRLMHGIGAGWLKEESEILGVDFPHRWSQTRIRCRDGRVVDQTRAILRRQVRELPAGADVPETGADGRSANSDRQQGQKRTSMGRAMGRRMVPDFSRTSSAAPGARQAAQRMRARGPRFRPPRYHDHEARAARRSRKCSKRAA
jgi:hypothetical protein